MTDRALIVLPFAGFYHSHWSAELDNEESGHIEYACDAHDADDKEKEHWWPEPLRLAEDKLANLLLSASDYVAMHKAVAKEYVAAFDHFLGDAMGLSVPTDGTRYDYTTQAMVPHVYNRPTAGLEFDALDSPTSYNFATDRVFAYIPMATVELLFTRSRVDNHDPLRSLIRDSFTSRSGFSSHYDNDLDAWLEKPLDEWDHNELGVLLVAALKLYRPDDDETMEMKCLTSMCEASDFHTAWSNAVDWPKFEASRIDARAELLADWLADDFDAATIWRATHTEAFEELVAADPSLFKDFEEQLDMGTLPYRCPTTPDLFECAA